MTNPPAQSVCVVSFDGDVSNACRGVLEELGFRVQSCLDGGQSSRDGRAQQPDCLVVDLDIRDGAAIDLLRSAREAQPRIPVVCISTRGTAASAVRALKAGAVDVLCMPLDPEELARAVAVAVQAGRHWQGDYARRARMRNLLGRLTPREHEVLALVLEGKLNKQIAATIGSQEATVKVHRSRMMHKLELRSIVALLKFGQDLCAPLAGSIAPAGSQRSSDHRPAT